MQLCLFVYICVFVCVCVCLCVHLCQSSKLCKLIILSIEVQCFLFRLSPRATSDMSGTLIRVRHTSPISETEPNQRLSSPEVGPQYEWSHLVDAANAYESEYLAMFFF